MITKSKYYNFFTYPEYRNEQENVIARIELAARKGKNLLFIAPNGVGKTIIALSALLPLINDLGLKMIYTCRTHSQSARVIKELVKVNEKNLRILIILF